MLESEVKLGIPVEDLVNLYPEFTALAHMVNEYPVQVYESALAAETHNKTAINNWTFIVNINYKYKNDKYKVDSVFQFYQVDISGFSEGLWIRKTLSCLLIKE